MRLACRFRPASGFILAVSLLGGPIPAAWADVYSFTTLDDPRGGGTVAVGINDAGQIVGEYGVDQGLPVGFLLSVGNYSTVLPPGSNFGGANGINGAGQIVGQSYVSTAIPPTGFLLSGGNYTPIAPPDTNGAFGALATGINASGQIVGWYGNGQGLHGFLLSGGVYSKFDDPNGVNGTFFNGINDAGDIVGSYTDSQFVSHGFLFSGGVFTTLDNPNAGTASQTGTVLSGINNAGLISGYYIDSNGVDHGFVLSHGAFTPIDDPRAGRFGTVAHGINDAGQVVGTYADTATHGFLATPTAGVPEPSTMMTTLLGGLAFLGHAWRRRRAARASGTGMPQGMRKVSSGPHG